MSSVTSSTQEEKAGETVRDMWGAILSFLGLVLFVITIVGMMEMVTIRHPPEHTLQTSQERNTDEQ